MQTLLVGNVWVELGVAEEDVYHGLLHLGGVEEALLGERSLHVLFDELPQGDVFEVFVPGAVGVLTKWKQLELCLLNLW